MTRIVGNKQPEKGVILFQVACFFEICIVRVFTAYKPQHQFQQQLISVLHLFQ